MATNSETVVPVQDERAEGIPPQFIPLSAVRAVLYACIVFQRNRIPKAGNHPAAVSAPVGMMSMMPPTRFDSIEWLVNRLKWRAV